ncbi:hypothetical protein C8Q75DRAFT_54910 [Abortiporus biennis]|nr:hypothetical protein C8Q75DRAFT_54910 [Abortiporus biennis]
MPQISYNLPRFPPEITDICIDYLWDDVPGLSACSLVCKMWHRASRYHLFSHLRIKIEIPGDVSSFLKYLDTSLCGPLILNLTINPHHFTEDYSPPSEAVLQPVRPRLCAHDFCKMVIHMPQLHTLYMDGVRLGECQCQRSFRILSPLSLAVQNIGSHKDNLLDIVNFFQIFGDIEVFGIDKLIGTRKVRKWRNS